MARLHMKSGSIYKFDKLLLVWLCLNKKTNYRGLKYTF